MSPNPFKPAVFISLVLAASPLTAFGQAQTFVIDDTRSSIRISGKAAGSALTEQAAGSLVTTYTGTVKLESTGGTIRFPGGSQVIAKNSGSWQPKADASAGTEPANYGGKASSFLFQAVAALRNVQVDVLSGTLPVSNGQFDSRSLVFSFLTNANGTLSYVATGFLSASGSKALAGYGTNTITTASKLESFGGTETLTLEVNATFLLTLMTENDSEVTLEGKVIATRSAAPPLVVQAPEVSTGTVTLRWQAEPGQNFKVHSSSTMQQWQEAGGNVTSVGGAYSWSESVGTSPSRFYKVSK